MRLRLNEQYLNAVLSANVGNEKNPAVRAVPLFIKNFIMGMAYRLYGESRYTCNLSNLGILKAVSYTHLQLADSLGFRLLAEYVETPEQRDRLAQLGCSLYQGYLYSPAIPLDEFVAFINRTGGYSLSLIHI